MLTQQDGGHGVYHLDRTLRYAMVFFRKIARFMNVKVLLCMQSTVASQFSCFEICKRQDCLKPVWIIIRHVVYVVNNSRVLGNCMQSIEFLSSLCLDRESEVPGEQQCFCLYQKGTYNVPTTTCERLCTIIVVASIFTHENGHPIIDKDRCLHDLGTYP